MFSVFSKSDKKGNIAVEYYGEIGREGFMNYSMKFPLSHLKINLNSKTEDRYNGHFRNVTKANLTIGGQKIKKEFAYIGEQSKINVDTIVHAAVAYDYVRKNLPEEAEKYLKALNAALSYNEGVVNSQRMLNRSFGEGMVDLDALVEAEVDSRLEQNNKYYEKYEKANAGFLGKLKDGLVKMTSPLKLAVEKMKDFFTSKEEDDYYDRF